MPNAFFTEVGREIMARIFASILCVILLFGSLGLSSAATGSPYSWGQNSFGELGDGTGTSRSTPVAVSGLSGVGAIAAGWAHSLAMVGPLLRAHAIGVFRAATGTWYLDANGNGVRDGCSTDKCFSWGGYTGDASVVGRW